MYQALSRITVLCSRADTLFQTYKEVPEKFRLDSNTAMDLGKVHFIIDKGGGGG